MAQVFISYATEDSIFADLVRMKLQEARVDVWIDDRQLRAGEEWRKAIDDGISSSGAVVVILTPASSTSAYVTYEWAFALGQRIKVIPVLLETADIHPRLGVLQYMDFRGDQRKGPWKQLIAEAAASPDREATAGSTMVGNMTVDQLTELIEGTVALAAATSKQAGTEARPGDISRASRSVADAVRQSAQRVASASPDVSMQILWVDDRPDNNSYERSAFEALGYRFTLAETTQEALDLLDAGSFGAIISDMGRREGAQEGYVLLEEVRRRGLETPYFIYAGSNAPRHKREATARGAQGSTNDPQELFSLVTRTLGA